LDITLEYRYFKMKNDLVWSGDQAIIGLITYILLLVKASIFIMYRISIVQLAKSLGKVQGLMEIVRNVDRNG
jgi:hypothetical protein